MHSPMEDGQAAEREAPRANTLEGANPYGLPLNESELLELFDAISGDTLHFAIGFLTGAATIPEPLSWIECVEKLSPLDEHAAWDEDDELFDDELFDDEAIDGEASDDEASDEDQEAPSLDPERVEFLIKALFEHVQGRVAAGALSALIPAARDATACDEWIEGFDAAVCQTLHTPSDEESEICTKIFVRPGRSGETARREAAHQALHAHVERMIELWKEVPPFDPEQEIGMRFSDVVPKRPELPKETIIHTGGTFVRPGPKVGRNDLCPCGSGKKYKKCCG